MILHCNRKSGLKLITYFIFGNIIRLSFAFFVTKEALGNLTYRFLCMKCAVYYFHTYQQLCLKLHNVFIFGNIIRLSSAFFIIKEALKNLIYNFFMHEMYNSRNNF